MPDYSLWNTLGTWVSGIALIITIYVMRLQFYHDNKRKIEIIFDWSANKLYRSLKDENTVFMKIINNGNKPLRVDSIGVFIEGEETTLYPHDVDLVINPKEKSKKIKFADKSIGSISPYGLVDSDNILNLVFNKEKYEKWLYSILEIYNDDIEKSRDQYDSLRLIIKGNGKKYYSDPISIESYVLTDEEDPDSIMEICVPEWKNRSVIENRWLLTLYFAGIVILFFSLLLLYTPYQSKFLWASALFFLLDAIVIKTCIVFSTSGKITLRTIKFLTLIVFFISSITATLFVEDFSLSNSIIESVFLGGILIFLSIYVSNMIYIHMRFLKGLKLSPFQERFIFNKGNDQ